MTADPLAVHKEPTSSSEAARRAASLIVAGIEGTELTDQAREVLDLGVGGIILFSRNYRSRDQVGELIGALRSYAGRKLVVSVDHEGGVVQRFREGFTRIEPMRAIGERGDARLAFELGQTMGRELRAVGIDWNFAPVLDVDTNPENPIIGNRSFSREPSVVGEIGVALAEGLESEGVASCGKHFPGHGDTSQDSHLELPELPHSFERLRAVELPPFQRYAEAGLASIMTAHVLFRALDPEVPATMSRAALTSLLREELGFQGLIVSDDLEMKAIRDHYGAAEAAERSLLAGADAFLCCAPNGTIFEVYERLKAPSSEEFERRLSESSLRMAAFQAHWAP